MNIQAMHVHSLKPGMPRIGFAAPWVREMGFVHGTEVLVVPEKNGMSFHLMNEHLKEKTGKLIKINRQKLILDGPFIYSCGLSEGDPIAVLFDYGFVRVRKLPRMARLLMPGKTKLYGEWLEKIGFVPDAVVLVFFEQGSVVLKLCENGLENYRELVKFARLHKAKIIQPRKRPPFCKIDLPDSCFSKDGMFLAHYEFGLIKLQKISVKDLGF
jgi:hypothetical protein